MAEEKTIYIGVTSEEGGYDISFYDPGEDSYSFESELEPEDLKLLFYILRTIEKNYSDKNYTFKVGLDADRINYTTHLYLLDHDLDSTYFRSETKKPKSVLKRSFSKRARQTAKLLASEDYTPLELNKDNENLLILHQKVRDFIINESAEAIEDLMSLIDESTHLNVYENATEEEFIQALEDFMDDEEAPLEEKDTLADILDTLTLTLSSVPDNEDIIEMILSGRSDEIEDIKNEEFSFIKDLVANLVSIIDDII